MEGGAAADLLSVKLIACLIRARLRAAVSYRQSRSMMSIVPKKLRIGFAEISLVGTENVLMNEGHSCNGLVVGLSEDLLFPK